MIYLDKQAVLSIINTFGDDDIYEAISGLTEYDEEINNRTYQGEWLEPLQWQLFEPEVSEDDMKYNINIRKIILHTATCSRCNADITLDDYDNYCPRCGAKMNYKYI